MTLDDRPITSPLTDADVERCFEYAELVAFAGLAARQFFDNLRYSGRDTFRLIVQAYTDPARGPLVTARRRDGTTNIHYSHGFSVTCPPHVACKVENIDAALLTALIAAGGHTGWPRLQQAIALFNEANTDRDHVPESAELVLAYAAFEQLLDITAKPGRLAACFEDQWQPVEALSPTHWAVSSIDTRVTDKFRTRATLRGAWAREFGVLRGSLAHGSSPGSDHSIWSAREHLLFAAYAFPRLVKLFLTNAGLYSLSFEDLAEIDAFEELLNRRHFEESAEFNDSPWSDAIGRAKLHRIALDAASAAIGKQGP